MINGKKVLVLLQARSDSRRLPNKLLRSLGANITGLKYLVARLSALKLPIRLATSDREVDLQLVYAMENCSRNKTNKYILTSHCGEFRNIAKRLYEASDGFEYIIRVTGDDLFVDIDVTKQQIQYAIDNNLDYCCSNIIRGCDCDIFKRDALLKAMEIYNTEEIESIEFLFQNDKFNSRRFLVQESFTNKKIYLSLDTPEDYKLIQFVFSKLYRINHYFSTFDIVEFFSRNEHLTDINKRPTVSVYIPFKNYPINWLCDALDSLSKQTFTDYECLLIDYGSHTIHKFIKDKNNEENLRTFFLDDCTFIGAIEYALSKASGKYILRLDADDVLCETALEEMVEYLYDNPFYTAVIPNHYTMAEDGQVCVERKGEELNLPTCALIDKKRYAYVKFLEGQDFRDGTSLIKWFAHLDFMIGYYDKPLFYYRIHPKSLTNGGRAKEDIAEMDARILNG